MGRLTAIRDLAVMGAIAGVGLYIWSNWGSISAMGEKVADESGKVGSFLTGTGYIPPERSQKLGDIATDFGIAWDMANKGSGPDEILEFLKSEGSGSDYTVQDVIDAPTTLGQTFAPWIQPGLPVGMPNPLPIWGMLASWTLGLASTIKPLDVTA